MYKRQANGIEDDFLKKGIMLVVDGTDPELVRGIMETDLACVESRHKAKIAVWEKWAELGPAWGMIGTLIGLILMLKNMEDCLLYTSSRMNDLRQAFLRLVKRESENR